MTPLGIYVHVPFCASKCPYCDFYSLRQGEDAWEAYTNCIIERIKSYQERALPVDTVYFGGGTPGLIGAGRIGRILDAVRESFRVQPGAEVTVETNPGVGDESLFPGLAAAGFAYLIGLPVLRLKSDYLAIATLGFAEILRAVFQWQPLGPITNGANMLKSFPTFSDFNIENASGQVVLRLSAFIPMLIAAVCIGIIVLLINSSYGRAFKAIREDEVAAEAMGINLARHKRMAFCISSFFAGVAGAGMAMVLGIAQANNFKSAMTYEILLMVVLGGIGSISGSVIGASLFIAASEWWLRGLDNGKFLGIEAPGLFRTGFRMVVFSFLIMLVVLFFRQGLMGTKELPDLFRRREKKMNKGAVQ